MVQAQDDLIGFTSPSGNIGCIMDASQVRCDIAQREWAPPPPPPDCPLDYGQGIVLDAGGPAQWVCAGDTALAGGPPLPFGESAGMGDLRCDSTPTGMTCRDVITGHGFSIARQGNQMF
ncbi:hypothetical protein JRC04_07955 [Mycolicibacterium sp. S2-37]|nr:hypothetical protein [Mycolicibacterium sp. S2-37]